IIERHCLKCHRRGGPAPLSLDSFSSVRRHAAQIASVTAKRVMPPWKADPVQPAFIGEQRLTDEEINTIGRWVAGGTSRGREVAPVHTIDEGTPWQLGRPDLVIEAPAAYTLRADGADVFHLFVIPVPLDQRRYVRGL